MSTQLATVDPALSVADARATRFGATDLVGLGFGRARFAEVFAEFGTVMTRWVAA